MMMAIPILIVICALGVCLIALAVVDDLTRGDPSTLGYWTSKGVG